MVKGEDCAIPTENNSSSSKNNVPSRSSSSSEMREMVVLVDGSHRRQRHYIRTVVDKTATREGCPSFLIGLELLFVVGVKKVDDGCLVALSDRKYEKRRAVAARG